MVLWKDRSVLIDGEHLNHLRFADNVLILQTSSKAMLKELKDAVKRVGLKMNMLKTKFITNLVLSEQIALGGNGIEEVNSYKYLGHEIRINRDNVLY